MPETAEPLRYPCCTRSTARALERHRVLQSVPPALTRADLLVLVRTNLRLARIDDATLGIDGMSDGGLRALLDNVLAALPSPAR